MGAKTSQTQSQQPDSATSSTVSSSNFELPALHGPRFEVNDDLKVVHWPEETAKAVGISAEEALNKWCWQIIHPGSESKPPACERFCLAKPGPTPTPEELTSEDAEHCAAVRLPAPQSGAIIWIPSKNKPIPIEENPKEELIVRGCMSFKLGDTRGTLDFIRRYCAADDCELFLTNSPHKEVLYSECEGPDRDAFSELTKIPFGAGYPGGVTARQSPMYTNDFQNERLFLRDSVRKRGIRSFLGIPLSEYGEPIGYIGLGWRDSKIPARALIRRLESLKPLLQAGILTERNNLVSRPDPKAPLSIRCLGSFEISRNGITLPLSAFARRRALLLLKILLLRAPQPVHRDVLIDCLWPESDAITGRNRLHGVVHALRAVIEPSSASQPITYVQNQQDFYFFNTEAPHFVDLFRFQQLLQTAKTAHRQTLAAERVIAYLESAVSLYHGDLFSDEPYNEWLDAPRTLLRQQYIEAVKELTRRYTMLGRHEDTIYALRAAITLYPHFEDLHQELAHTLIALDRRVEAAEQLKACLRIVQRDCGTEPLPETLKLLRALGIHQAPKVSVSRAHP